TSFGSYELKRYRFTGKARDEESGLNYHGGRYYAPGLGRWMCPDPEGTVGGGICMDMAGGIRLARLIMKEVRPNQAPKAPRRSLLQQQISLAPQSMANQ
ncbi:hypothetical protein BVG81_006350, partial [Haliangium sp. UPWRP_2]